MEILIIIIGIVIITLLVFAILELRKRRSGDKENEVVKLLFQKLTDVDRNIDQKFTESQRDTRQAVEKQLSESQELISRINREMNSHLVSVTKEIAESKESSKQIFNVAESLKGLENTLKNQKTRGNLGETGLELILGNMLQPEHYTMQYQFPDGSRVDAIIRTPDGFVPVDAKFSLENYNRMVDAETDEERERLEKIFLEDLKRRIDETATYIKPSDGTLPFAFMFIPAEGIYYDILTHERGAPTARRNLITYAYNERHVIITSPTTFSAYLHSVLYGFRALKIEEATKDIFKNVGVLGKHLKAYEEFMNRLGNTLGTATNHYNHAAGEFAKINKDVTKITGDNPELLAEKIEKE